MVVQCDNVLNAAIPGFDLREHLLEIMCYSWEPCDVRHVNNGECRDRLEFNSYAHYKSYCIESALH